MKRHNEKSRDLEWNVENPGTIFQFILKNQTILQGTFIEKFRNLSSEKGSFKHYTSGLSFDVNSSCIDVSDELSFFVIWLVIEQDGVKYVA